jgi:signal transduction histidine kinase
VRDLERKNEELDLARRHAERLSSFKSQFLANMSHELRTPLNAVIGFSELLTDENNGPLTESQREFVNYVLDGGRHLLTLINDILDLSKIEAGRIELNFQTIAPRALIDSAREIIRPFALKQGVTVNARCGDGNSTVTVDPVRVKQVLFNLLSNAVKFTPAGGTVTVDSSVTETEWLLAITDTGIGIRPQDLPRLFREFERIESLTGPKPEGTGLGLALTKRLIELHGGTVEVTSTPGQGSTFTVRFPISPAR